MGYAAGPFFPQQELESVRRARMQREGGPGSGPQGGKKSIGKTSSGKDIPHHSSSTYAEKTKLPKYSGAVSVHSAHGSDSGKLLRQRLPDWSKQDHTEAAQAHRDAADKAEKTWSKVADSAAQKTFGRPYQATDYHISGIASDKFDDSDKNKLRTAAHDASDHRSAADAHERAGKYARSGSQESREGGPGSGPHKGESVGVQSYSGAGKLFHGYRSHTVGEDRPYHILEGAGKNGGQWAAYEAKKSGGSRELAVFNSRAEAEDHAEASQPN